MKDNILRADFNEETGVSTVTVQTKWGTFTHSVTVDEEDKEIANKWDGCKFAHYLCVIDKMKAKSRAFRERSIGMDSAGDVIIDAIRLTRTVTRQDAETLNRIREQAYFAAREANRCADIAKRLKEEYPKYIEETLSTRRKLRQRSVVNSILS